jgi:hypothetical protein
MSYDLPSGKEIGQQTMQLLAGKSAHAEADDEF